MIEYKIVGLAFSEPEKACSPQLKGEKQGFNYQEERPFIQSFVDRFLSRNNRLASAYLPINYAANGNHSLALKSENEDSKKRYESHLKTIRNVEASLTELAKAEDIDKALRIMVEKRGNDGKGILKPVKRFFEQTQDLSKEADYQSYLRQIQRQIAFSKRFGCGVSEALIALHDLFKSVDDTNHVLYTVKLLYQGLRPFTKDDFKDFFQTTKELDVFWKGLKAFAQDTDDNFIALDFDNKKEGLAKWLESNYKQKENEINEILLNNRLIDRYAKVLGEHFEIFLPVLMMHQIMGASFTNTSYSQLMHFVKMPDENLTETQIFLKNQLSYILIDKNKTKDMLDMLEYLTVIDTAGSVTSGGNDVGYLSLQALETIQSTRVRMERVFEELSRDIPLTYSTSDQRAEYLRDYRLTPDNMVKALKNVMNNKGTDELDIDDYVGMTKKVAAMYVDNIDEPQFQDKLGDIFKKAVVK